MSALLCVGWQGPPATQTGQQAYQAMGSHARVMPAIIFQRAADNIVTTYGDGHGNDLIDYWPVHGMNHAWSAGSSSKMYADQSGPNERAAMYAFFAGHPLT